jgi:hypothetical protein
VIDWTAVTAVVGSITTLDGTLGGYWFSGRNDEARDKRADQRETRARRAVLAERLEEERHTFQRDTFLELQNLLLELARWSSLVTRRKDSRGAGEPVPATRWSRRRREPTEGRARAQA